MSPETDCGTFTGNSIHGLEWRGIGDGHIPPLRLLQPGSVIPLSETGCVTIEVGDIRRTSRVSVNGCPVDIIRRSFDYAVRRRWLQQLQMKAAVSHSTLGSENAYISEQIGKAQNDHNGITAFDLASAILHFNVISARVRSRSVRYRQSADGSSQNWNGNGGNIRV